jgi:iron complex transport system ATP-binding protein
VSQLLLSIDDVTVTRGDAVLLDRVSLSVAEGRHTAILGRNGSGKSTLVRLIARDLYPAGGGEGVRIFGESRWDVFELRKRLGIVSPALHADLAGEESLEVMDAVLSGFFAARGLWRHHKVTADMRAAAVEALERMGASALVGRRMATLSTGEARRVLIARALVHRPAALLLDEPCAGLDPATRRRFLEALRGVTSSGTTLIMVTHHVEEILPEIDQLVLLADGRVLAQGSKEALLTGPVLTDLFGMATTVERRGDWFRADLG